MIEKLDRFLCTWLIIASIRFLPPRIRKMHFSYSSASTLLKRFSKHVGLKAICLFSERARDIVMRGDKKKLSVQFLGSTKLYPVASITMNFRSLNSLMKMNTEWPLNTIKLHEQAWQTLIHEMAHAASVREPSTRDDHGLPFFWRMVKVYIFVWYHCYFGVLRRKKCVSV